MSVVDPSRMMVSDHAAERVVPGFLGLVYHRYPHENEDVSVVTWYPSSHNKQW